MDADEEGKQGNMGRKKRGRKWKGKTRRKRRMRSSDEGRG